MSRHVFISYSSENRMAVDVLCRALEDAGLKCWTAPRDVAPGSEYAAQLVSAIASARLFVLLLSSAANRSPHVRREVERAVGRRPILNVRIEDVVPSESLEYFLASTQWLDAAGRLGEAWPILFRPLRRCRYAKTRGLPNSSAMAAPQVEREQGVASVTSRLATTKSPTPRSATALWTSCMFPDF